MTSVSNEALVNALSMMSPYQARDKQALLEAADLKSRAEVLVALTTMAMAGPSASPMSPNGATCHSVPVQSV